MMTMPNQLKATLRKICLAKRDGLTVQERRAGSRLIGERLAQTDAYLGARTIGFYCAFGSEVETWAMMRAAFAAGRRVFLPTIDPGTKLMTFSEHDGNIDNLVCNFFGIQEPQGPPGDSRELDLIVVPGVAFDPQGRRLGYGAGYYDRFLKGISAPTIGVAFANQIAEAIPLGENDVPVDFVVTENDLFQRREPKPEFS